MNKYNGFFRRGKNEGLLILITLILLVPITFTGCNNDALNEEVKENKVKQNKEMIINAELTDKEKGMLSSIVGRYLVFDIQNLNDSYKKVDIWVDKYEKDKLVGKIFSFTTAIEKEDKLNRILLTTLTTEYALKDETWILSWITDKGTSAAKKSLKMLQEGDVSSAWASIDSVEIVEDKTINLGTIIINISEENENSSIRISTDFLENEVLLKEYLLNNDYVYILRCKFSKEQM